MEWLEAIAAALGLKVKTVVAGAVGSFVSLRFFDGLSTTEKWSTFFGGWALAAYASEPLTAFLELGVKVEVGLALLVGLFGMSIVAAAIKVIRETKWSEIVKGRLGGGGS